MTPLSDHLRTIADEQDGQPDPAYAVFITADERGWKAQIMHGDDVDYRRQDAVTILETVTAYLRKTLDGDVS